MAGPTIYDIASHAGVGIATVSRVLNGKNRVSDKTRRTVQDSIEALGFRPNHAAQRLAAGAPSRPRVVALMPFFTATFYFSVSKPLSLGLAEAGIDFIVCNVQDRDGKNRLLDRLVEERSAEALLFCSMGIGEERRVELETINLPSLAIDYPVEGIPSVTVDNVRGGANVAEHLLQTGAQHLALISGTESARAFRDRELGFHQVVPDAPFLRADDVTVDAGRRASRVLLDQHPGIDAIACVNDSLAVGALEELKRRGVRVPEEVQVVGFDDQPGMSLIGLTTMRQPMTEFGDWAAKALRKMLETPGGEMPPSEVLPLELIERLTTRTDRVDSDRRLALGYGSSLGSQASR